MDPVFRLLGVCSPEDRKRGHLPFFTGLPEGAYLSFLVFGVCVCRRFLLVLPPSVLSFDLFLFSVSVSVGAEPGLSCLVLSINLIHCGNEFRNSVPVRTLGL